jgi:hypothetical protein
MGEQTGMKLPPGKGGAVEIEERVNAESEPECHKDKPGR